MSLNPGTRLGSYEVLGRLGAGGMGEVYRARDTRLDREVALKVLPESFALDAERVARFDREARTLASLNHPHIAQVHGFEQVDGVRVLATELVVGDDLSQRMRRTLSVVLLLASVSCASNPAPQHPSTPAPQHPSTPAPESIRWVRSSAEYHAALYQVYRLATTRVEQAVAKLPAGSWAVILDADETVLDNSLYQLERAKLGLGFTPETWNAWVKRREATPLPGSAAFLARVRALGGKIAIVTNRLDTECDDTRAVFDASKLAYDAILCRVTGTSSDKNPRFTAVAGGQTPAGNSPMAIVAIVGDNIMDFPQLSQKTKEQGAPAFTEFGVRYFLVPNPMYGSWQ